MPDIVSKTYIVEFKIDMSEIVRVLLAIVKTSAVTLKTYAIFMSYIIMYPLSKL